MKYIDAEKLKGFVGELKKRAQRNCYDTWGIVPDALEEVEGFIISHQQEQQEPSNNLVDVDAIREDFITEVYRVLDADPTNDRANAIIGAFDSLPTVSQEQPELPGIEEPGIPGKDFIPVEWVEACERYGRWKIVSAEQPVEGLEEAAKRYAHSLGYDEDKDKVEIAAAKDDFIAGAEWMAGQGQTFEAHVDNGCAIASGVKLPFVLWDTYEDGGVLKVQIRKKQ